jgi:ATP-dependent RNA helicase RhlE
MTTFLNLNLSDRLLGIIKDMGYNEPTPIQTLSIPKIIKGLDVLGVAETGSGKTAAFSLPLIEKQIQDKRKKMAVLVLEPTRELAVQTAKMIGEYAKFFPISVHRFIGGEPISDITSEEMRSQSHFIVATPGAMLGLVLKDQKMVGDVSYLILDEADKLLQLNFLNTINQILYFMPVKRQTIMFTSTLSKPVERMAKHYLNQNYEKITIDVGKNKFSKPAETIDQFLLYLEKEKKPSCLVDLLNSLKPTSAIIFLRTQARAEKLFKRLKENEFKVALIHGGKTQETREYAFQLFKSNEANILVTTDLASRGLDISDVSHVINFDLPAREETYVHRIGRTGRAGKDGIAINFAEPMERVRIEKIQRLIRRQIPLLKLEGWENIVPPHKFIPPNKEKALKIQKQKRQNRIKLRTVHKKPLPNVKPKHTLEEYIDYKKDKKVTKRKQKIEERQKKNNT